MDTQVSYFNFLKYCKNTPKRQLPHCNAFQSVSDPEWTVLARTVLGRTVPTIKAWFWLKSPFSTRGNTATTWFSTHCWLRRELLLSATLADRRQLQTPIVRCSDTRQQTMCTHNSHIFDHIIYYARPFDITKILNCCLRPPDRHIVISYWKQLCSGCTPTHKVYIGTKKN